MLTIGEHEPCLLFRGSLDLDVATDVESVNVCHKSMIPQVRPQCKRKD